MMTNAEATKKLCPFVQIPGVDGEAMPVNHCLGSECAVWKWEDPVLVPKDAGSIERRERKGFCEIAFKV